MPTLVRCRGRVRPRVSELTIKRRGNRMLRRLGRGEAELSVLLCDDAVIRDLNRGYRGRDAPTDVLAFALEDPPSAQGSELLGDVVISLSTARRQAAVHGHSLLDEVTQLLAHGVLHLVGYDHATPREERTMQARTRQLVRAARG